MVEESVMKWRAVEKQKIDQARAGRQSKYPVRYEYHAELLSVRRKEFKPLWKAKSILQDLIPTLSHESDGLIFQVCLIRTVLGSPICVRMAGEMLDAQGARRDQGLLVTCSTCCAWPHPSSGTADEHVRSSSLVSISLQLCHHSGRVQEHQVRCIEADGSLVCRRAMSRMLWVPMRSS